jgi:hypothetical protein
MIIAELTLILLPLLSQGELVSIRSSVDKAEITVGDPITYTLSVTREESVKVDLPHLGINLGGFEIRDYNQQEGKRLKDGRILDRVDYLITIYQTGEFELPSVEVEYTTPTGERGKLSSQPIRIVVESVKPNNAQDIKPIKGPVGMSFDWRRSYKWGGLLLLVAGAGGYFWWRKRRVGVAEEGIAYTGPPRPAHLIAYEELERIAGLMLIEKGQIKRYYTELSEVIRRYISRRYEVGTMELTTNEIVEEMVEVGVEGEHISHFREFLEECDLVKFAKYHPPRARMEEAIVWARSLVERTKSEEIASEASPSRPWDGQTNEVGIAQIRRSFEL